MFYDYDELLGRARQKLPHSSGEDVIFKAPFLDVISEGSRTLLRNFAEVCDIIQRKPEHLMKFLTRELATKANLDGKRLFLIGKFNYNLVNARLQAYVKEFVICPACGRHETELIKDDRITMMKCNACGASTAVRALN